MSHTSDDEFDGDLESLRRHYERLSGVYDELALLGDEYPTLGFAGTDGWYQYTSTDDVNVLNAGFENSVRCTTFERDWETVLTKQLGEDDRDREIFNISSWKAPEAPYQTCYASHTDDGTDWKDDEKPTPGYDELRGFGFWCDLDLSDKAGRSDLTDNDLQKIEQAQQSIIEKVAALYGVDESDVYALDSGGGAYVYGPPETALPIVEHLNADERELFFDDMRKRMRDEFASETLWPAVEDEITGIGELLDPDWIQNVNRQTKAPGAIHHNHDLVVTPLRVRHDDGTTGEVDYTPTKPSELTESDIENLERWCAGLTSIEYTDPTPLLEGLYPELMEKADSWEAAISTHVRALVHQQQIRDERRTAADEYIGQWTSEDESRDTPTSDGDNGKSRSETGLYNGSNLTDDKAELQAALDTINIEEVVKKHACDSWDTSSRSHETTFDPSWRQSSSGKSCAVPNNKNNFIDNSCNAGGGPAKAYALGEISGYNDASDSLGSVFGETLNAMRDDDYEIPVYIPTADGDDGDQMPLWAMRKAAVVLDICSPDDFTEQETVDGETYLGFDAKTFNRVLDGLEDKDMAHGRDRANESPETTPDGSNDSGNGSFGDENDDLKHATCSPTEPAGQLVERNGCYGYKIERDEEGDIEYIFRQVTNFLLETVEFLQTDDGEQIRLRVHPSHPREDPYEKTIQPIVFNESREFKRKVVTGRTTQFESQRSSTLNELRETVGAQEAPERESVNYIGAANLNFNEIVTPEGVITESGWASDPKTKYHCQTATDEDDASIVGEKWKLTDDFDTYDDESVRDALRELPKVRLSGPSVATLGWFYSAPLKPLVHDETGEFNHLQVRGKTESGKTSYLELLVQAFGMGASPWSASSTAFSLEQLHVGSRGSPVWIDEYKPSDMYERNVDRLHRFMRMATKESTRTKGRPDQSHLKFRMQSPIVLSGEQQINEAAVRRRAVQVNLSTQATEQRERVAAYSRLAGETYKDETGETVLADGIDLRNHALAYYQFLTSKSTDTLRDIWQTSKKEAVDILDEEGMELRGSELQGAQTVVFGYRIYNWLAKNFDLPESERPDKAELQDALVHIAENVGAGGQRREHGDEFLELAAQAANAGKALSASEAEHANDQSAAYRVYNPDTTQEECLAIHMPTMYPAVKRYVRDYNLTDETSLLGKNDYIDEYADLVKKPESHVAEVSVKTRLNGPGKRCLHLDPHVVAERLGPSFDLTAFGLEPNDDDRVVETEDDENSVRDIDTKSLKDAATNVEPYPNVKGEIMDIETPEPENAPELIATLDDDSTAIDLVCWDDDAVMSLVGEPEDLHEGDEILIQNASMDEYKGTQQIVVKPITEVDYIEKTMNSVESEDEAPNKTTLTSINDTATPTTNGGATDVTDDNTDDSNDSEELSDGPNDTEQGDGADEANTQSTELVGEPLDDPIAEIVAEHDGDISEDVLIERLQNRGAVIKQINVWLEKCKKRGDIIEPEEGVYRT